jgi:hypothetical protein
MADYQIHMARGSLWARQQAANHAGCICYVETHMNAVAHSPKTNYVMCVLDANASQASKDWAKRYCELFAKAFDIPNRGALVHSGRGAYNLRFMRCPAILTEGGFISNPEFAAIIRTGGGIEAAAGALVESIRDCFPDGGLIGLSAGHAYRDKPDPGAPAGDKGKDLDGDGAITDPDFDDETEMNIAITDMAAELLVGNAVKTDPAPPPSERLT